MKKKITISLLLLNITFIYAYDIFALIDYALNNNYELHNVEILYITACLSEDTHNALFSPGITISASSNFPSNFQFNTIPNYYETSITYSQIFPGGRQIGISSSYLINSIIKENEHYQTKIPNISFSYSQSLLPFWVQGERIPPEILSLQQEREYYYNNYLYTKKSILQNLFQNYIYAIINKKEISIYENTITFLNEQIKDYEQLVRSGNINQSSITEIELSKWNKQKELISYYTNYETNIQNIQNICGIKIDEDFLCDSSYLKEKSVLASEISSMILTKIDNKTDPLEENYLLKCKILKTSRVLEKQNQAIKLNLILQPEWTTESILQNNWQYTLKNLVNPSSWTTSISLNFSSLLSDKKKQSDRLFQYNYESAQDLYISYRKQKDYQKQQYLNILSYYEKQINNINKLYQISLQKLQSYEMEYKEGAISKLDFLSLSMQVDNYCLEKECMELYTLMYKVLLLINF